MNNETLLEFDDIKMYRSKTVFTTDEVYYINSFQKNTQIKLSRMLERKQEQQMQKYLRTIESLEYTMAETIKFIGLEQRDSQQLENVLYQALQFTVESIFNRKLEPFKFDCTRVLKNSTILYFQQLKSYLHSNQHKGLDKVLNKLKPHSLYYQLNSIEFLEEDGFYDENRDQQQDQQVKNTDAHLRQILHNEDQEQEVNEFRQMKKLLLMKDKQIGELKSRLDMRDNTLSDITSGYLKDVQHMRELLFRKAQLKDNDLELYEVHYFDQNDGFDDKTVQVLNQRVKELKMQFEERTKTYMLKIMSQQDELSKQKNQIQSLQNKLSNLDNPTSLLHRAFLLEKNEYRLWKIIQDLKGNQYFFNVFENQKATFGINYREIDKYMMQTKAYEREYTSYKLHVNEQVNAFMERQVKHHELLKQEITEKECQISILKDQKKGDQQALETEMHSNIQVIIKEREEQLKNLLNQHEQLYKKKKIFDMFVAKEMLRRWMFINRMMKVLKSNLKEHRDLKKIVQEIIIDPSRIEEIKSGYENDIAQQRQAYDEVLVEIESCKMKNAFLLYDLSKMADRQYVLENDLDCARQQILLLKKQIDMVESQKHILKTNLYSFIRVIDPRILNVKPEDINLDDHTKEFTKELTKRIKNADSQSQRSLNEIVQWNQQQTKEFDVFIQQVQERSIGTQTQIVDVEYDQSFQQKDQLAKPIFVGFTNYHKVEKWLLRQMGAIVTSEKQLETELTGQMMDEIAARSEKIQTQLDELLENHSKLQQQSQLKISFDTQPIQDEELVMVEDESERPADEKFEVNQLDFSNKASQLIFKKNRKVITIKTKRSQSGKSSNRQFELDQRYHQTNNDSFLRNKDLDKSIFDRLYLDSKRKQERLEILKNHIDTLDQYRWEQILSILNYCNNDTVRPTSSSEKRVQSKKSSNPERIYQKAKRKEESSLDHEQIFNILQGEYDYKKTNYVENMLVKFKNKTKRMMQIPKPNQGTYTFRTSENGVRNQKCTFNKKNYIFLNSAATYDEDRKNHQFNFTTTYYDTVVKQHDEENIKKIL